MGGFHEEKQRELGVFLLMFIWNQTAVVKFKEVESLMFFFFCWVVVGTTNGG